MTKAQNRIIRTKVQEGAGQIFVQVKHLNNATKEEIRAEAEHVFRKYLAEMQIETDEPKRITSTTIEDDETKATTFFSFFINEK